MSEKRLLDINDRDEAGQAIAWATRLYGIEMVKKHAQVEKELIMERGDALALGRGERFFRGDDWMGYSGASRFPDGVDPIIAVIRVRINDEHCLRSEGDPDDTDKTDYPGFELGSVIEVEMVISADEDGQSFKALTGFSLPNLFSYTAVLNDRLAALTLCRLIASSGVVDITSLYALGFST